MNNATRVMMLDIAGDAKLYRRIESVLRQAADRVSAYELFQEAFENEAAKSIRKCAVFATMFMTESLQHFQEPDGFDIFDVDWMEIASQYRFEDFL